MQVHLQYVKGHAGIEGNEGADYCANQGAVLPQEPERDWDALVDDLQNVIAEVRSSCPLEGCIPFADDAQLSVKPEALPTAGPSQAELEVRSA